MAVLVNCTCGSEPVCEPGAIGSRNWNVCCFNCGARSATFVNRTEAVMSWNQIIADNQKVVERPAVTGVIDQAIQLIRNRQSVS
ncbi:hypothetical protein [Alkalimarinus alittae]|uniref:Uncharacterized protein n=1 Tax=Alkalimarinus alittae TaxID=2961619 RepID=A0ABY6N3I8_9ALTE|nr:hypothetical protein [Alkalimarinus alittae]UZE96633.1 hypothetical protein NKI27_02455 [Alkalimarinus alittae]